MTVIGFSGMAQKRQKVYSIVKQAQTDEWYKTQATLWEDYLKKNPQAGDAWLNYYTASRMLKIQARTKTQEDLNAIVEDIEKAIPNSFEFHFITFWNAGAGESEKNFHHLEKAHELAPDRPELYSDFFTYYEVQRDKEQLASFARKWFNSNDISPGLYAWNYNMLMSCDEDAILLTVGDNDTYPALILQYAKDIRTDINVINTSLMAIDGYRAQYFEEMGIPAMNKKLNDYKAMDEFYAEVLEHLDAHTDRPIYFTIAAPKYQYASIDVPFDRLYLSKLEF